jgi:hypothetical protein
MRALVLVLVFIFVLVGQSLGNKQEQVLPPSHGVFPDGQGDERHWHSDLERFLSKILLPGQLYLEINPTSLDDIYTVSEQLTQTGVVVLFHSYNFQFCSSIAATNIICLQAAQNLTIDEILASTISLSLSQPKEVFPAIIKISRCDLAHFSNTRVMKAVRSLFYIQIEDSQETNQLIDSFIAEGL